jgi:hypothetical protein
MQNSFLQTFCFILFLLSLFCTASMLPCGRYYYEPEGGYVGNPWVKFSWQYIFLYLAWLIHHIEVIEHFIFQLFQTYIRHGIRLYTIRILRYMRCRFRFYNFNLIKINNHHFMFQSGYYGFFFYRQGSVYAHHQVNFIR